MQNKTSSLLRRQKIKPFYFLSLWNVASLWTPVFFNYLWISLELVPLCYANLNKHFHQRQTGFNGRLWQFSLSLLAISDVHLIVKLIDNVFSSIRANCLLTGYTNFTISVRYGTDSLTGVNQCDVLYRRLDTLYFLFEWTPTVREIWEHALPFCTFRPRGRYVTVLSRHLHRGLQW